VNKFGNPLAGEGESMDVTICLYCY